MDWKREVVVVPVADVERSREFYVDELGFRLDTDHRAGEDFRSSRSPSPARPRTERPGPTTTSSRRSGYPWCSLAEPLRAPGSVSVAMAVVSGTARTRPMLLTRARTTSWPISSVTSRSTRDRS